MKDFKEKETIRFFLHQNSINLFFSVKEDFSLPADVSSLQVIVLERLTLFCENIRLDLIMNIESSVGNDSHHDHLDSHFLLREWNPLIPLIVTMASMISLLTSQCTMRRPMSIDISEVLECKHSFHAHFK